MRRWRSVCCLAAAGYIAVWASIAFLPITSNDMDGQYWPAVREVIAGRPLHIYSPLHAAVGPDDGPASLIPLTVAGYVLTWLGWMENAFARRALASAVIGLLCLLMSREAIHAVERLRGEPLPRRTRLWISAALLGFPALWAGGLYGHIELPVSMWLLLMSLRRLENGQAARGGIVLGLALLARSTSALFVIPICAVLLRQYGFRKALTVAATAMAAVAAGIAPFAIADPGGVQRSLIEARAHLPVRNGTLLSFAQDTSFQGPAVHGDIVLMVAAAMVVTTLALRLAPGIRIGGPQMFALLMGVAACYPLMAKSVWPYYLFEASVFGLVLWFGEWNHGRRWRFAIPALMIVMVSLIEAYQVIAAGSDAGATAGVAASGLLIMVILEAIGLCRTIAADDISAASFPPA